MKHRPPLMHDLFHFLSNLCAITRSGILTMPGRLLILLIGISHPFLAVAQETVRVEPDEIVFDHVNQTELVRLLVNDAPVPGTALKQWKLLVNGSNYSHMLRVVPLEEGIQITPSASAEVGSYEMALSLPQGEARLKVFTPLSEHRSSMATLARRLQISEEELNRHVGRTQSLGREQISLELPPVCYLGQRIALTMPVTPGRMCTWKANEKTIAEGPGVGNVEYVADTTGPLMITYEEREGDRLIGTATALAEVCAFPPVPLETNVKTVIKLRAPEGFAQYEWFLNGEKTGESPVLEQSFKAPGDHVVKVVSRNPTSPGSYAFREDVYTLSIK